MKHGLSLNFILLLGAFALTGASLIYAPEYADFATFAFVLLGWVVGLCLHEFGHAYSAWRFGDHTIEQRNYLGLDPVAYINGPMSIILPIIILAIGGIALPGAAVLIRPDLIRERWQQSLVSLAGPVVTLVLAFLFYALGHAIYADKPESLLGDAVILLAFFHFMAFVLNMLPLPGLDGYGVITPLLPQPLRGMAEKLERIPLITIVLVVVIFFFGSWHIISLMYGFTEWLNLDLSTAFRAYDRFQFWE
ncbi:MAG: site-2 protease family protein [Asticcacaulis sp.]